MFEQKYEIYQKLRVVRSLYLQLVVININNNYFSIKLVKNTYKKDIKELIDLSLLTNSLNSC